VAVKQEADDVLFAFETAEQKVDGDIVVSAHRHSDLIDNLPKCSRDNVPPHLQCAANRCDVDLSSGHL